MSATDPRLRGDLAARSFVGRSARSSVGQLVSTVVQFALPLAGAVLLGTREYALWVLLVSVSTVTLNVDLGASAFAASRFAAAPTGPARASVLRSSNLLNLLGSGLIGALCIGGWFAVGSHVTPKGWTHTEGLLSVMAMVAACTVRGSVVVAAQAAMAVREFLLRDVLLIGQSIAAVLFAVALTYWWRTAWMLPISYALSCVPFAAYGTWTLASRKRAFLRAPRVMTTQDDDPAPAVETSRTVLRRFAVLRTLSTIVGTLLFQADRWILAIVGGPALLGVYEISWRICSFPRVVMISAAGYLVTHGAEVPTSDTAERALVKANRLFAAVGSAGFVAVLVVTTVHVLIPVATPLWIVLPLAIALTLNGITAATTNLGIGRGHAGIDLRYLVPALAGAALCWAVALIGGWSRWVVVGSSAPVAIASVAFIVAGPSLLKRPTRSVTS